MKAYHFFGYSGSKKNQIDRERQQLSLANDSLANQRPKKVSPTTQKLNITMFGPSLSENGGMGAVQKQILTGVRILQNKNYAGDELALYSSPQSLDDFSSVLPGVRIKHLPIWNGKTSTIALFSRAVLLICRIALDQSSQFSSYSYVRAR